MRITVLTYHEACIIPLRRRTAFPAIVSVCLRPSDAICENEGTYINFHHIMER